MSKSARKTENPKLNPNATALGNTTKQIKCSQCKKHKPETDFSKKERVNAFKQIPTECNVCRSKRMNPDWIRSRQRKTNHFLERYSELKPSDSDSDSENEPYDILEALMSLCSDSDNKIMMFFEMNIMPCTQRMLGL